MATMYPKEVHEKAQSGEKLVYEKMKALPEDWIVIHDCWQHFRRKNYTKKAKAYINYEADFIVLVPKLGIAVLEVKDWHGPLRILDGEWQCHHEDGWLGMGHKHSPLNQAHIASKQLRNGLRDQNILPQGQQYEVRCMAVMLNQVPADLPPLDERELKHFDYLPNPTIETLYLCGEQALEPEELEKSIRGIFTFKNTNMTPELMKRIVNFLAPCLLFQLDIASYSHMMELEGAPIRRLLPMLDGSKDGIRVDGCAGSGKTVMACCEAARLANKAKAKGDTDFRLLLLCFNRKLAEKLRTDPQFAPHMGGCEPRVDISTFHAFCIDRYITPAGQENLLNDKGGELLAPEALNFVAHQLTPTYDAIFVDEAQDFCREWWDRVVLRLLKPGGRLRVFADTNQNIYRNNDDNIPYIPTRVTLDTNLRNVRQIAAFSSAILPEEMRMNLLPLCGADVTILPGSDDPRKRAKGIAKLVMDIRKKSKLPNMENVFVLSPWADQNPRCSFPLVKEFLDVSIMPKFSTIKSFKGLEALFVILADIPAAGPGQHPPFTINDLYVACTRARYSLAIVPTVAGEGCVRRFLEESAQLASPE